MASVSAELNYTTGEAVYLNESYNYVSDGIYTNVSNTIIGGLNGTIDEVMIFNRSLSVDEIRSLYNSSQYSLYKNLTTLNQSLNYTMYVQDTNATIISCLDNQCPATGGELTNDTLNFNNVVFIAKGYETATPSNKQNPSEKSSEISYLLDKYKKNELLTKKGVLKEVPEIAKATKGGSWSVDGLTHWNYENILRLEKENQDLKQRLEQLETIIYGTEGKQIITEPMKETTKWWEFWK